MKICCSCGLSCILARQSYELVNFERAISHWKSLNEESIMVGIMLGCNGTLGYPVQHHINLTRKLTRLGLELNDDSKYLLNRRFRSMGVSDPPSDLRGICLLVARLISATPEPWEAADEWHAWLPTILSPDPLIIFLARVTDDE